MRILYYNWVEHADPERRGGGVAVYQRNLIEELLKDSSFEIYVLSSGISYNFRRRVYVREITGNGFPKRYEIVNSGVMAPGHSAFFSQSSLSHPETLGVFEEFLLTYGPFDVVHFNNLEGLPADVLSLRKRFQRTKFVLSLHNYFPFCSQVNLWYKEREHCSTYINGRKCLHCLEYTVPSSSIKAAHRLAYYLKSLGISPHGGVWRLSFGLAKRVERVGRQFWENAVRATQSRRRAHSVLANEGLVSLATGADYFVNRRSAFVDLINAHIDDILAVSNRVALIARAYGIRPHKIKTLYIGTKHAEEFYRSNRRRALLNGEGKLVICYLGYMRRDKGFYFLLEALKAMPVELAREIRVVVAAPNIDGNAIRDIEELILKFDDVFYSDGYTHEELDAVLSRVTLGVVPVLWEDNLPQVAVEMYSRGISLLCSDRGGAQELGGTLDFAFRAGDTRDFIEHVRRVVQGDLKAEDFWRSGFAPVRMKDHVVALTRIYSGRG